MLTKIMEDHIHMHPNNRLKMPSLLKDRRLRKPELLNSLLRLLQYKACNLSHTHPIDHGQHHFSASSSGIELIGNRNTLHDRHSMLTS